MDEELPMSKAQVCVCTVTHSHSHSVTTCVPKPVVPVGGFEDELEHGKSVCVFQSHLLQGMNYNKKKKGRRVLNR